MRHTSVRLAVLSALFLPFPGLAQAASPKATAPPDLAAVEIRSDGFHPQNVTIKVGGTVRWVNKDTTPHTVHFISTTPGRPDGETEPIPPGQSVEVGFKASDAYYAGDHPSWTGMVTCPP